MRERNALDQAQGWARSRRRSSAERLRAELELCELVGRLRAGGVSAPASRLKLEEKARLWAAPLKILAEKTRQH